MAYAGNLFGGNGSAGGRSNINIEGRVGSNQWADDTTGLFLKKFAGEVMTVFDEKNIMKPLHTIRTISKGKSAQFPVIGTAGAGYYTPGSDILGADGTGVGANGGLNQFKQTEVLIHIDKMLMANTFISSIDELVSHFDVRAPYTHQLGEALANEFDKNVLKVAIKTGAKNSSTQEAADVAGVSDSQKVLIPADPWIAGQTKYGSVVYSNSVEGQVDATIKANTAAASTAINKLRYAPDAAAIRKALFESARLLDEKDVPQSDRYAIITPAMYYELVNNTSGTDVVGSSLINKDVGGEGSIAAGTIVRVAGITLLTSNHLPSSAATNAHPNRWEGQTGNNYDLDYTHCAGLVFQKGGFGTLKLQDLTMESEYLIARQGNLFVAKYSMGHGPLRPESVVVWSDGTRPETLADADVDNDD
tara:strand:- start:10990 stop:12243 length:1254 start_codon:yes stop_codon:yes gene_type:complete